MRTTPEGLEKIRRHEAFREFAYPDPYSPLAIECRALKIRARWGFMPASQIIQTLPEKLRHLHGNPWTCGYGETQGVTFEMRWSREEALQRLRTRVAEFEEGVLKRCTVEPNLNQLMALTSFSYNVGLANFAKSTVCKAHNRGDFAAAARAFHLWNKAGKPPKPSKGLTERRAEEAALYVRPVPDEMSDGIEDIEEPPSQMIEPERPMTESTINRASVVAGGTAAVATVAETARTVADVKYSVASLGDWLVPILLLLVVALCGYIIWERFRQRREGFA